MSCAFENWSPKGFFLHKKNPSCVHFFHVAFGPSLLSNFGSTPLLGAKGLGLLALGIRSLPPLSDPFQNYTKCYTSSIWRHPKDFLKTFWEEAPRLVGFATSVKPRTQIIQLRSAEFSESLTLERGFWTSTLDSKLLPLKAQDCCGVLGDVLKQKVQKEIV